MSKRRSRLELYVEVLKVIGKGVNKPTNIMYKCNLSWINLKEILNFLLKQNFISVVDEDGRKTYRLTERGREVLEHFSRAQMLLTTSGERKKGYM